MAVPRCGPFRDAGRSGSARLPPSRLCACLATSTPDLPEASGLHSRRLPTILKDVRSGPVTPTNGRTNRSRVFTKGTTTMSKTSSSSSMGRPTRRQFGRTVAGSAVERCVCAAIVRGRNLNEKLNIAIIGAGGRGAANLAGVAGENIVALCDVYEPAVERAAIELPSRARAVVTFASSMTTPVSSTRSS